MAEGDGEAATKSPLPMADGLWLRPGSDEAKWLTVACGRAFQVQEPKPASSGGGHMAPTNDRTLAPAIWLALPLALAI